MTDEQPPSGKTMRYDRQLRLWGEAGQTALENASVCLVNATTYGCEILKNLILPGVGEVHVVDQSPVTANDVQTNFFLAPGDIGKSRSEAVIQTLGQLNPETKHRAYNMALSEFVQTHMTDLKRFTVFIVSNVAPESFRDLAQIAWDSNIPVIVANIVGMYTETRVVVREHCVIESKPDNPLPDLRLDIPFTELIEFYQNIDLSVLNSTDHAHIPFVLILLKCLDQWKAAHGGEIPRNYKEKTLFKSLINKLRRKPDEENFNEACGMVNKCVVKTPLPSHLDDLFSDPSCTPSSTSTPFWLTAAAVKQFFTVRGVLPVSGTLEDMTADTQSFIALQTLYRDKARADSEVVAGYVAGFVTKHGFPPGYVGRDYISKFSRNSRYVRVLRTQPVECPKDVVKEAVESFADDPVDLSHVFLLFQACLEFVSANGRWPGDTEDNIPADEVSLLAELQGIQVKQDVSRCNPHLLVKDLVRFGGTEVPSVAAFSGGVAAHECIKLITCQYVPVDSCFVYSGGSQTTSVLKL